MSNNPPTKPTLGVCPEHIWRGNRVIELCRAVSRRAEAEREGGSVKYIVKYQEADWFRPRKSEPLDFRNAELRQRWHQRKPNRIAWIVPVEQPNEKGE